MSKWQALYKSSRPLNLFMIGLTMYAVRYGLIYPNGLDLPDSAFFYLVSSIMLLAAGGNVINDFFDQKADSLNKPGKNLIGRHMTEGFALSMYKAITLTGLLFALFGFTLAIPMGYLLFMVNIFIAASLWIYSRSFMKQVLIGNVLVAMLVASLPFLVYHYEVTSIFAGESSMGHSDKFIMERLSGYYHLQDIIYAFCFFAFTVTMARELTKDVQDLRGDRHVGYRTFPVVYGAQLSLRLAAAFIILTGLSFSYTLWEILSKSEDFALLYFAGVSIVNTPLFLAVLQLMKKGPSPKSLKRASSFLKLAMLFGILSLFAYCFR